MDCLFRSLALATARKAKKRIMMVLARQLCRIRTGALHWWCAGLVGAPGCCLAAWCHKGWLGGGGT